MKQNLHKTNLKVHNENSIKLNFMMQFLQNLKNKSFTTFLLGVILMLTPVFSNATGLSGTYTIGSGGNYSSFAAAISALNTNGVSGPVTFNVASGTYNEGVLTIGAIGGASATNTITFKSTSSFANTAYNGSVVFSSSSYVSFIGFTITASGYMAVYFNASTSCSVLNSFISTPTNQYDIEEYNANYSTVSNCHISGGNYGLYVNNSNSNTSYGYSTYSNNRFVGWTTCGIWEVGAYRNTCSGNVIDSCASGAAYSFVTQYGCGEIIKNNQCIAKVVDYCLFYGEPNYASSSVQSQVYNNFCANSTSYISNYLYAYTGSNIFYAHNTIIGNNLNYALYVSNTSSSSNIIIANNIIYGGNSSTAAAYFQTLSGISMLDGNDYYNPSGSTNPLINLNGSNYSSLSNFQSALSSYTYTSPFTSTSGIKFESSATSIQPSYISTVDPVNMNFATGATIPKGVAAGIATDILGLTRSTSTPTAGAVEGTGGYLNFSGSSNYISLNNSIGNFGTGDFTIQERFRTSSSALMFIFSKRPNCNGGGNFISIMLNSGKLEMETDDASNNYTDLVSSATYNDGNWHQVTAVRRNNVLTIYVDGTSVASGTSNANLSNNTTTTTLGQSPCTSNMFNGDLDEVL